MIHPFYLALPVAAGLAAAAFWPQAAPADDLGDMTVETVYRSKDGHFYVDAKINDTDIRFLVDTGSSAVALSERDARRAKLDLPSKRYSVIGQGASGVVRGVRFDLDSVQLGKIREENIDAAVVEGATVSLLGAPFLRKIDEIVIRGDRMEFRDKVDS